METEAGKVAHPTIYSSIFLAYLQPTKLTGSIPLAELSRAIQEHTLWSGFYNTDDILQA